MLLLPQIARLYGVTVDDFYKKNTPAYENYAARLSSVYELTDDPTDFMLCVREYDKLMKTAPMTTADKWNYAIVHHQMLHHCRDIALDWYEKAKADDPAEDMHSYYRARDCRGGLYITLGRGEELIREQERIVQEQPDNVREICLLIGFYCRLDRHQEACELYRRNAARFPDDWRLFILGGDAAAQCGYDDEALACYDRAGLLGTDFHDEMYCKAAFCEDRGDHQQAYDIRMQIAALLKQEGFDVEADMTQRDALKARAKMNMDR